MIRIRRLLIPSFLIALYAASPAAAQSFLRGDANQDGAVDLSDTVSILLHLFSGAPVPECHDAADTNDSGGVDLSDAVFVVNFLFLGGPAIAAPFPECGEDTTADGLDCDSSACPQEPGNYLPPMYRLLVGDTTAERDGNRIIVRSTGIPNHPSPYFPDGDPRWEAAHAGMRLNPNRIGEQDYVFRIPANPQIAATPTATSLGPIGFAVNGVPLFNQYAAGNEPLDREIQSFDAYSGHPARQGVYHYHIEPAYLTKDDPSALIGILKDGFPIYGPLEADGSLPVDLDECNGHTHPTPEYPEGIYHYHTISTPPYIAGCYKGTPGTHTN
ncbi:MAG: YHYH protein [Planctomycetota bacterium]